MLTKVTFKTTEGRVSKVFLGKVHSLRTCYPSKAKTLLLTVSYPPVRAAGATR